MSVGVITADGNNDHLRVHCDSTVVLSKTVELADPACPTAFVSLRSVYGRGDQTTQHRYYMLASTLARSKDMHI